MKISTIDPKPKTQILTRIYPLHLLVEVCYFSNFAFKAKMFQTMKHILPIYNYYDFSYKDMVYNCKPLVDDFLLKYLSMSPADKPLFAYTDSDFRRIDKVQFTFSEEFSRLQFQEDLCFTEEDDTKIHNPNHCILEFFIRHYLHETLGPRYSPEFVSLFKQALSRKWDVIFKKKVSKKSKKFVLLSSIKSYYFPKHIVDNIIKHVSLKLL